MGNLYLRRRPSGISASLQGIPLWATRWNFWRGTKGGDGEPPSPPWPPGGKGHQSLTSILMVFGRASSALGMRTSRIPWRKVAFAPSAFTSTGRVMDRLNAP